MTSEKKNGMLGVAGLVLAVLGALVGAALYAAGARASGDEAIRRLNDIEPRLRCVEQFIPRIDERLAAIQKNQEALAKALERHERSTAAALPK